MERISFWSNRDYQDLVIAAHQQLGGPVVLVRDNLNVHKAADLRKFAQERDRLTIYYVRPRTRPQLRRRYLVPATARLVLQRRRQHSCVRRHGKSATAPLVRDDEGRCGSGAADRQVR